MAKDGVNGREPDGKCGGDFVGGGALLVLRDGAGGVPRLLAVCAGDADLGAAQTVAPGGVPGDAGEGADVHAARGRAGLCIRLRDGDGFVLRVRFRDGTVAAGGRSELGGLSLFCHRRPALRLERVQFVRV